MEIKSLEEVKAILKKFPQASGVGYVVAPQIIKIAKQVGLVGYDIALENWNHSLVINEKVYGKSEEIPANVPLLITWEGASLSLKGCSVIIGLKRTLEDIEEAIKGN